MDVSVPSDAVLQLLLSIGDSILTTDQDPKLDEREIKAFNKAVANFLKILQKAAIICVSWLDGPSEKQDTRERYEGGFVKKFALRIEHNVTIVWPDLTLLEDGVVSFSKKLKLDSDMTGQMAVRSGSHNYTVDVFRYIVSRLPIDPTKSYGLYIPDSKTWIEKLKPLKQYPTLASEKVIILLL